jgi:hypothetical protein
MKQPIGDSGFPIQAPVRIRISMHMKTQGIEILKAGKLAILIPEIQLVAPFPDPPAGVPLP